MQDLGFTPEKVLDCHTYGEGNIPNEVLVGNNTEEQRNTFDGSSSALASDSVPFTSNSSRQLLSLEKLQNDVSLDPESPQKKKCRISEFELDHHAPSEASVLEFIGERQGVMFNLFGSLSFRLKTMSTSCLATDIAFGIPGFIS